MSEESKDQPKPKASGDEWGPARLAELAAQPAANKPAGVSESEWRRHRIAAGHMVIIRSHFKSIYLIPMAIISLFCGVTLAFAGADATARDISAVQEVTGLIWMMGFSFYMSIFMFEWSRAWTYAMFLTVGIVVILGWAINSESIPVYDWVTGAIQHLDLMFSQTTFFFFAVFFFLCAMVSIIKTRLNYVVVERNEVLVYRNAIFGDRQRLPMMNRRVMVRVPDMLEFFHPFYGAGEIIIHASDGEQDLVLDNVRNIRKIERGMDRLGSSLSVISSASS